MQMKGILHINPGRDGAGLATAYQTRIVLSRLNVPNARSWVMQWLPPGRKPRDGIYHKHFSSKALKPVWRSSFVSRMAKAEVLAIHLENVTAVRESCQTSD
jgi:hypothetical protein